LFILTVETTDATLPASGKAKQVELRCQPDNSESRTKTFEWSRNGVKIANDSKYEVYQNGSLIVKDVGKKHI